MVTQARVDRKPRVQSKRTTAQLATLERLERAGQPGYDKRGQKLWGYGQIADAVDLSENSKVGPLSISYAGRQSCWRGCGMWDYCYATFGPIGWGFQRMTDANPDATPEEVARAEAAVILERISGRWPLRLHGYGDCNTDEAAHIVSHAALKAMRKYHRPQPVFTYTHSWRHVKRASWGQVSVLASCEKPEQIAEARALGYAASIVVDRHLRPGVYDYHGVKVRACPHQTHGLQCIDCRLCFDDQSLLKRGLTIAFEPHGSKAKACAQHLREINGQPTVEWKGRPAISLNLLQPKG